MEKFTCDNPYTGEVVVERPLASAAQLREVVARSARAQREWRRTSIDERIALVDRMVRWFEANADEVARDISTTMGKPLAEAMGEVNGLGIRAQHMASIAAAALADEELPPKENFRRFIAQEPVGVVLVLAPWNYPLLTAVNGIAPAVLAGNGVVIKHAHRTPLCGEHFERAFRAAGAPEGLVANVHTDHATARSMYELPDVGYVAFTGSVRGGHEVYSAVAEKRFIDVGLELGGKDPGYVAEDADVDHAIANLVDGAFYNAGQSCCGIERIYVHEKHYDRFVSGAVELVQKFVLGDPLDQATTLGPLAQPGAPSFLEKQVAEAKAKGARVLCGGAATKANGRGRFFAPSVVAEATHEMSLMVEESFGPVVGIAKVASDDEAVRVMNDSPYGLTCAVWTRDPERAISLGRRLETGTVFMNRCDYLDPALPWTGVKDTGKGESLSSWGFHHVTRRKSFHLRVKT